MQLYPKTAFITLKFRIIGIMVGQDERLTPSTLRRQTCNNANLYEEIIAVVRKWPINPTFSTHNNSTIVGIVGDMHFP